MTLIVAIVALAVLSGMRTLAVLDGPILDGRSLVESRVGASTQLVTSRLGDAHHRSARAPPTSQAAHDPLHVHPCAT